MKNIYKHIKDRESKIKESMRIKKQKQTLTLPKVLTWSKEMSDEEKIDNLKLAMQHAKYLGKPYLSENIKDWESEIKEIKESMEKENLIYLKILKNEIKESMENNEITAEWARKTVEYKIGIESDDQLQICLSEIEKAVEDKRMSVAINLEPHSSCMDELNRRGFKTRIDSYDWLVISW